MMLTWAALGMVGYGLYSAGSGVIDIFGRSALELWADLGLIVFGAMLMIAAALVRVVIPGGLALALGAMFGLQALALHSAAHLYGQVVPLPQLARALFAATLVLLAYMGARNLAAPDGPTADREE